MGHDTESNVGIKRVYECQVCGFKLEFFHEPLTEVQMHVNDWCVHAIDLKTGVLNVLACPACSELRQDSILDGWKKRVMRGDDVRYH